MDHNPPHPRRDLHLQGPRPSPLRVSKDSRKITKPPPPPHQAPREPLIIYTISPKIIHVEPANFMDLVQRLTGASNAEPSSSSEASPAARLAANAIHNTLMRRAEASSANADDVLDDQLERSVVAMPGNGILSPAPASLPPVSPGFFSPTSSLHDPMSFQSFLREMSMSPAGFQVGRDSGAGNFVSPVFGLSPGWDVFNRFEDF